MANYNNLKATINANIKANGNEEITGPILNTVLNQAVTTLGAGYQYMGVATPATSPGTPDANVFYIAATPGTYTNFGGKVVADGEVAILKYNGSWAKEVTGAATAAQVTQLGQVVDGKEPNYTAGKYLKSDGTLGDYALWGVTDFVPYTTGNKVVWKFDSANHNYYIGFFNSNKQFISGSDFSGNYSSSVGGREISVSSINSYAPGAAYIRASFNLDYANAAIIVGDETRWTPQEATEGIATKVDGVITETGLQYCQLQPKKIVGQGYYQSIYIYKGDSKITSAASNGSYVIPVTKGEHYRVRGSIKAFANYVVVGFTTSTAINTVARALVTVDSNTDPYSLDYNFVAPDDGYLMVWSTSSTYGSSCYVEIIKQIYRQKPINDYYLPSALKLQTFGDSITDNSWGDKSSWVNYIPDNIETSLTIVNSGIGGSTVYGLPSIVQNGGTNTGGETVQGLQSDADFVTIFIGTNDWASGRTLSECQTSLASALQYITEHSSAKILFCTPLQRYNTTDESFSTNTFGEPINANNISLREFCDGLVEVCKVYSVPVLDLHSVALINRYNIGDYSLDGLHPHRGGDIYVSRLICKKIKEMLRN